MSADRRVEQLGLVLPPPSGPAGNYAAAVRSGNLVFLSAKAPLPVDGVTPKGRIGAEYSTADGQAQARSACINLLATLRQTLGSLDRVTRVVELQGFINASADFEQHAQVLDGASDLLADVFGPAGVHARSVVGVGSLRNGLPLTLRAVVEVDGA